jgi:S1-C subfamily serine protease
MGAKFGELNNDDREEYNISSGVKITDIGNGYLSELGLRSGTIVLRINGNSVKRVSEVKDMLGGGRTLYSIEGIQPNGTFFSYEIRR